MTQSVTQAPRSPSAIELQQIQFTWASDREPTLAIDALHIAHGEHVFLQGPSGCGKSTLLSLLTGIQTPQQGEVTLLGTRLSSLSAAKRDRFRAEHIGYIYQQFNLIPYLSLIDNVLLPCRFAPERATRCTQNSRTQDGRDQAGELLTTLGLDQSLWHKAAHQLSIGQQQRVAAARALIGSPEIIIADEPTSALDHDHRQRFIDLLLSHTREQQTTVLFVSHDPTLADFFDRTLSLPHINQQGAR